MCIIATHPIEAGAGSIAPVPRWEQRLARFRPARAWRICPGRCLGSSHYAIAIALATNARTDEGFRYIANPDDFTGVAHVCVPSKSEARQLERSWEAYERAVNTLRLPRMSGIGKMLLTIPPDQPVAVVAWMRKDQADRLKTASGQWKT
jgi:hypothetical protein